MSPRKSRGFAMCPSKRSRARRPPISFTCSKLSSMLANHLRSLIAGLFLLFASAPVFAQQVYEDLIIAVANDRADEVKRLLARGMDPNSVDRNGDPLLFTAARAGYRPTVDVLLAAKANVNAKNRFGDTPLMAAALNGHLEIVRRLRTQGADLEPRGWTPLIYAATGGHD